MHLFIHVYPYVCMHVHVYVYMCIFLQVLYITSYVSIIDWINFI